MAVLDVTSQYHLQAGIIPWSYCALENCECSLPKVCLLEDEECVRVKACASSECDCDRLKVCSHPHCNCERPKVITSNYGSPIKQQ